MCPSNPEIGNISRTTALFLTETYGLGTSKKHFALCNTYLAIFAARNLKEISNLLYISESLSGLKFLHVN